jgi:hypothetical protein
VWTEATIDAAIRDACAQIHIQPNTPFRLDTFQFQILCDALKKELLRAAPPAPPALLTDYSWTQQEIEKIRAMVEGITSTFPPIIHDSIIVDAKPIRQPKLVTAEQVVAALLLKPDLAYAVVVALQDAHLVGPWESLNANHWVRRVPKPIGGMTHQVGVVEAYKEHWHATVFPDLRGPAPSPVEMGNAAAQTLNDAKDWVDTRLIEAGFQLAENPPR